MPDQYRKQPMAEQYFQYSSHPRENVSWYQAVAFTRWLSDKLGYEVRLPREEEWEKAARGTDGRSYPWGLKYIPGYANVNEVSASVGPYSIGLTTAVGMYSQGKSPYGVLDMSGNVWEWCLNKYGDSAQIDVDASGEPRVVRGGSWFFNPEDARCACRNGNFSSGRSRDGGFRVVASSERVTKIVTR
jgi:formylglycine-generating enzyme required for sulfatase activity